MKGQGSIEGGRSMIRVSVLYPHGPDKKFDWDYYINKHMVTADQQLGPFGLVRSEVDRGVGSAEPGAPAPFVAIAHLYFNSMEDFQKAFSAHGAEAMADIPNFTDIQPQIQISDIVK